MARIEHVDVEFVGPASKQTDAAALSFRSIFDVLEASDAARQFVADGFPDLFDSARGSDGCELTFDSADGFWVCGLDGSAIGASSLTVTLKPSERYGELAAAVAAYCKIDVVDRHGWPILSVGDRTSTDTGSGGGCKVSPVEGPTHGSTSTGSHPPRRLCADGGA